jgi:hypothetical protein
VRQLIYDKGWFGEPEMAFPGHRDAGMPGLLRYGRVATDRVEPESARHGG